jgi:hypothetical protein
VPFYIGLTWRTVGWLVVVGVIVGLVVGFLAGRAFG